MKTGLPAKQRTLNGLEDMRAHAVRIGRHDGPGRLISLKLDRIIDQIAEIQFMLGKKPVRRRPR